MVFDSIPDGGVYHAPHVCRLAGVRGVNWLTERRHHQQQQGQADGRRAGSGGAEPGHAVCAAEAVGTVGGGRKADAELLLLPAVTAVGL